MKASPHPRQVCSLLSALFLSACNAGAQTPANPSFEANAWSPGLQTLIGSGAVNSWTYNANGSSGLGVKESSPYGPTPYGGQFVVLDGSGANHAYIEQTISGFTPNIVYRLSFSIASEAGGVGNTPPASRPLSRIGVTLTGTTTSGMTTFTADRRGPGVWDTWICQEVLFQATATSVTIRLEHVDPLPLLAGNGVALDNLKICDPGAGCPAVECMPFAPAPFPLQCGMAVATCFSGLDGNYAVIPTNPVMAVVDLRNPAANTVLGQNWFCPMFHNESALYATNFWTAANLGQVFGVTLDNASPPNIYATATTVYGYQPGGPDGPGAVHRISGANGNISLFAVLPNGIMSNPKHLRVGPALGNICFDPVTQKFFVSDFEDGNIYGLDTSGNVAFTYDHGVTGRPIEGLSVLPDNGIVGQETQIARKTWGVQVDSGRLYYSVGSDMTNDVWSVLLAPNGQPYTSTAKREFTVPPYGGNMFSTISSIDLSCNRMLLAERSTGFMGPHTSRLLEYQKNGGTWNLVQIYNTSPPFFPTSSAGGGDIACDGSFWVTSDRLLVTNPPPGLAYGLLNILPPIYNANDPPGSGYVIDLNGVLSGADKNGIGDLELYNCCCMGIGLENVICTNGVFVWSFTVTNTSAFSWSSLALTNLPGGVTLNPSSPRTLTPPLAPGGKTNLQWGFTAPGYAVSILNFLLKGLPSGGSDVCELAHCIQLPEACCPNIVLTNYIQCLTNAANTNQWHLTLTNHTGTTITAITISPFGACVSLPGGNSFTLTNFPPNALTNLTLPIQVSTNCGTNLCFEIAVAGPQTNFFCHLTHCVPFTCVVSNRCPTVIVPHTGIAVCATNLQMTFTATVEDADLDPLTAIWLMDDVAVQTNVVVSGATNTSPLLDFARGLHTVTICIWDHICPPVYKKISVGVGDPVSPTLSCTTQQMVFAGFSVPTPDFVSLSTATDDCTPTNQIIMTQSPVAGTPAGPGLHDVILSATDLAGNTSTLRVSFKVGAITLHVDPTGNTSSLPSLDIYNYDSPTSLTFTALGGLVSGDNVTFHVSDGTMGNASNAPFSMNWTPASAGLYDVWAVGSQSGFTSLSPHAYLTIFSPPVLGISLNASNQIILTWTTTNYVLTGASALGGIWTDVTGAVSPHAVAPTNSQQFFRLRSQ